MTVGRLLRAREMRRHPTLAEAMLWRLLRRRHPPFRRQHIISGFIVDFVSLGGRLVIEVDGGIHNESGAADAERERALRAAGYRILRVTNDAVLNDADAVAALILAQVAAP